jgi:hypothetical protein
LATDPNATWMLTTTNGPSAMANCLSYTIQ